MLRRPTRRVVTQSVLVRSNHQVTLHLQRRVVFKESMPVVLGVPSESSGLSDLIYCGLEDGSLAVASMRVGGLLSTTVPLRHGRLRCLTLVGKLVFLGCEDGSLLSFTTNMVQMDSFIGHGRGACHLVCETHLIASPVLAAFADDSVVLLSDKLMPLRSIAVAGVSSMMVRDTEGTLVLLAGNRKGQLLVFVLPDLTSRGSLTLSTSGICALAYDDLNSMLWAGSVSGSLSFVHFANSVMSPLPSRHAHRQPVVSLLLYPHVTRLLSRSMDGHLCWWNLAERDLEAEVSDPVFAGSLPLVHAGRNGIVGACDEANAALSFYTIAGNEQPVPIPAPAANPRAQRISKMDMAALMVGAPRLMALYVAAQQYRQQLDPKERRATALRMREEFFSGEGVYDDLWKELPSSLRSAISAKLTHIASDASLEPPLSLFDSLAANVLTTCVTWLCTVCCVLCTVYCVYYCVLCTAYCTLYCVLCAVYCVLFTAYCVLCSVGVLCTVRRSCGV
jgi:hypothetical protein